MIELTANEASSCTGARLVAGDGKRVCRGCVIDSREVVDDSIFVAFPGERVDGNAFARPALENGAGCVVLTCEPPADIVELATSLGSAVLRAADDDPTEFMLRLASAYRSANDWLVVGLTGSVGKTTTKEMLAAALRTRYRVHATVGNLNNLLGVPLTILSAPADAEALVVEMGMNHKGEIERLSAVVRPQVALITNVGTSHIGLLGSREAIARAKGEIVSGMSPSSAKDGPVASRLFLWASDDYSEFIDGEFARPAGIDVELVGTGEPAAVRLGEVTLDDQGLPTFRISFSDGWSTQAGCQVPGRTSANDFAMAMAVAEYVGCNRAAAAAGIAAMAPAHMRLETVVASCGARLIDDSYNASPGSMASSIDVLCSMACTGRRIAVLGEMGELGEESPRLHGLVGAYAAAKSLDMLVCIGGELSRTMAESARIMGMSEDETQEFDDVDAALETIAPILGEGDLVLAKASRASGLDRFVKGVVDR